MQYDDKPLDDSAVGGDAALRQWGSPGFYGRALALHTLREFPLHLVPDEGLYRLAASNVFYAGPPIVVVPIQLLSCSAVQFLFSMITANL